MDVILLERVEKLGHIGDVVTVKTGFARNFLLPNKKALRANAANKKLFEANRAKIESDNADRRVEALAEDGAKVSKSQVVLGRPIKAIGMHEIKVVLHAEVIAIVKVNVARSPEEAELQAQGVDVMSSMFERDEAGFTEDYDPNAEPGTITDGDEAGAAEAETAEVAETDGEEA